MQQISLDFGSSHTLIIPSEQKDIGSVSLKPDPHLG
mgnify:CR=1 FL=1